MNELTANGTTLGHATSLWQRDNEHWNLLWRTGGPLFAFDEHSRCVIMARKKIASNAATGELLVSFWKIERRQCLFQKHEITLAEIGDHVDKDSRRNENSTGISVANKIAFEYFEIFFA